MHSPCQLCRAIVEEPPLAKYAGVVSLADAYPVSPGHLLLVPIQHVESVFDLPNRERAALFALLVAERHRLKRSGVEAFTVGCNDGVLAGQTIAHAHIHLIPRRAGDVANPRGGIRGVIPGKANW